MTYDIWTPTRVLGGLPCQALLVADCPIDGMTFELYTLRGKRAAWLEARLTPSDTARVTDDLIRARDKFDRENW